MTDVNAAPLANATPIPGAKHASSKRLGTPHQQILYVLGMLERCLHRRDAAGLFSDFFVQLLDGCADQMLLLLRDGGLLLKAGKLLVRRNILKRAAPLWCRPGAARKRQCGNIRNGSWWAMGHFYCHTASDWRRRRGHIASCRGCVQVFARAACRFGTHARTIPAAARSVAALLARAAHIALCCQR
eukprot:365241-Chlamydomonas_euryale.AAC.14